MVVITTMVALDKMENLQLMRVSVDMAKIRNMNPTPQLKRHLRSLWTSLVLYLKVFQNITTDSGTEDILFSDIEMLEATVKSLTIRPSGSRKLSSLLASAAAAAHS